MLNLVIKVCLFAYFFDQNRPQPKHLLKKPKPLFSQLKLTETEPKN